MKGLTEQEWIAIKNEVSTFHGFKQVIPDSVYGERMKKYPKLPQTGFGIRLMDAIWNVETQTYTYITFRTGRFGICFDAKNQTGFESMYELCFAYLTGEFVAAPYRFDTKENINE